MVGVLNEVLAAAGHEYSLPAVQCESKASPDLLEGAGLAHPGADVKEPGMLIGELGGGMAGDVVESAGQIPVRACDEARDLPRVLWSLCELGLD